MSTSRFRVFGWALAAVTLLALFSASLGPGEARAGDCAALNYFFYLGNVNTCNITTRLNSTANPGLSVNVTNSGPAIEGQGGGTSGLNTGVYGHTDSSAGCSFGVWGELSSNSPESTSAAVAGFSNSTTANGPGVWGSHFGTGRAPGVLGETGPNSGANAAGVSGIIASHADYSGGVRGENFDSACCGFGVVGFHAGQGIGIGGYAPNGFGVFGWSPNNGPRTSTGPSRSFTTCT